MTLQQLQAFAAVADCGSFRAASRRLAMSQAGLTTSLQALESSLGVQLLERSVRGTVLTDNGERLLPRARRILGEVRKARQDALLATDRRAAPAVPAAGHVAGTPPQGPVRRACPWAGLASQTS